MKKKILITITSLLSIFGVVVSCVPFAISQFPSLKKYDEAMIVDFAKLEKGIPYQQGRLFGKTFIILKPTKEQQDSINKLTPYTSDPEISTYHKKFGVYAYVSLGTKHESTCVLKHFAKSDNPFPEDHEWLGGFWDPVCESSYDYAGRHINDHAFSYNGFTTEQKNLTPLHFKKISENQHYVSW